MNARLPSRRALVSVLGLSSAMLLASCRVTPNPTDEVTGDDGAPAGQAASGQVPERFTIVPDDYHVPYAGTAEDGRRFFLSEELFDLGGPDGAGTSYVGLFLWNADGSFDDLRVDAVPRPDDVPPGQAAPADADGLVASRLAELGDYVLEPIEVEPFTRKVDGVRFGWAVGGRKERDVYLYVVPGDFIAYYPPFDGLEYDT